MFELIFFALFIMLGWGVGDFILAYLSKKGICPYLLNLWGSIISLALISVVYFAFFFPTTIKTADLPLILLYVFAVVAAFIFFYKAFAVGKASLISPITSSYGILSMFFGLVFLKESLTKIQYIGIIISFVGLLLAVINLSELKKLRIKSEVEGLKYAVATFILWGFTFTLSAVLTKSNDWVTPFFYSSILAVPLSFIIFRRNSSNGNSVSISGKYILLMVVAGMLLQAGALAYTYSVRSFPSALLAPISAGYPAVIILLAHFFFKERISIVQYVGVSLIIAGLVVAAV